MNGDVKPAFDEDIPAQDLVVSVKGAQKQVTEVTEQDKNDMTVEEYHDYYSKYVLYLTRLNEHYSKFFGDVLPTPSYSNSTSQWKTVVE